jgi:nucleoside 2-deoxyribosyltransferase
VFEGTIVSRALTGTSLRFVVRAGEHDLIVRCLDNERPGLDPGAVVQLGWAAADATLLAE